MRTLFLFLLHFRLANVHAQSLPEKEKRPDYKKVWALTVSPLALAQIDYTATGGAEYRLNKRLHLVADAGYIFSSSYMETGTKMREASGFIFRPGLKYFPSPHSDFYLQPQVFYKQVTHYLYDWLDKDVVNGIGAYQQLQDFRYRRTAYGFNAVIGSLTELGSSDRFYLDAYIGIGLRQKVFGVVGEKGSFYNNRGMRLLGLNESGSLLPSLPMGLRLLYKL